MPSPSSSSKKERFACFISRLRSNRTASGSSLVLQTGFPTSLADLVVKNRDKFKKRRKISSFSSDLDPAAVPSRSDAGDDRSAPVVESPHPADEVAAVARRGGRGLGFLTVKAAALVVLAVGRKWVVVGVTVLTFGLLIIEMIGSLKLKSRGRNSEEVVIERVDLRGRELASPIREIECSDAALIESEDDNLGVSESSDSRCDLLLERRCFDADDNCSRKSKRKKLFKRLFGKKNRRKRDEGSSTSSLDDSRVSHEEVDEISDNEEYLSFGEEDSIEVLEVQSQTESVGVVRDDGSEFRLRRWRKLVFFVVVVLLGLLGGKGVALLSTVAWFFLSGYTGKVLKRWKMQRID